MVFETWFSPLKLPWLGRPDHFQTKLYLLDASVTQSWWQLVGKPFICAATIDDESAFSGVPFNILTGRTLPTSKKGDVPLPGQMIGAASFRNSKCWWIKRFWETILFQTNPNVLGCDAQVRQGNPRHQILRNHPFWHWRIWWIPLQFFHSSFICFHHKILVATGMVYGGYQFMKIHHTHLFEFKWFSTINLPSTHTWRGIVRVQSSQSLWDQPGLAHPGPVGSPHNTRRCTDKEPPVEQGMKQEVPEVKNWRQLLGRCKYICVYIYT